jgi:hypothetical protein
LHWPFEVRRLFPYAGRWGKLVVPDNELLVL